MLTRAALLLCLLGVPGTVVGASEVEVARAARHVSNCADQGDGIALEATLARLERAYDLAISEIWDFRAF